MWQFCHVSRNGNRVAWSGGAGVTHSAVAEHQRFRYLTQARDENPSNDSLQPFYWKLKSAWSNAGEGSKALVFMVTYEWFSCGKVNHPPHHSKQTTSVPHLVDVEEHDSLIRLKGKMLPFIAYNCSGIRYDGSSILSVCFREVCFHSYLTVPDACSSRSKISTKSIGTWMMWKKSHQLESPSRAHASARSTRSLSTCQ